MTDIRTQIARLPFVDTDSPERVASEIVHAWHTADEAKVVHYIYYASYVLFHKNRTLLQDYSLSDYLLVDGIGMQICFKIITGNKIANLNGTDMSPLFFAALHKIRVPLVLYGTTEENIRACNQKLISQYGEQAVAYFQNGFSPLDFEKVPDKSALIVGTGSPRQEQWVSQHIDRIREKKLLVFTVGGYFDFLSGFYVRAPKWVRVIKMEWAWRTMLHPGRHYQKRLRDLTIFFLPFVHKLKSYKKYISFRQL